MPQHPTTSHIPAIHKLWKSVFGDTDAYIDAYFEKVFKTEHCVIVIEDDELCAALQILPYTFLKGEQQIRAAYIFAVMTAPDKRKQGHMSKLIDFAFSELRAQGIPFVFLIPQEPYLFDVYVKYGFQAAFKCAEEEIDLFETTSDYYFPKAEDAYALYLHSTQYSSTIVLSLEQFLFVHVTLEQEGGKLIAVKENDTLAAFALCYIKEEAIRAIEWIFSSENSDTKLRAGVSSFFNKPKLLRNSYASTHTNFLGMAHIFDETALTYAELQNTRISMMMNE